MKYTNETYNQLLEAIHDIRIAILSERLDPQYEQGWDDAMCRVEDLMDSFFAAQYGQPPLEHRLDTVPPQRDDPQGIPHDPVNHPSHYTSGKIEVIDFLEDQQFPYHLGNAVKYISRAGKKDPARIVEDLEKAVWYLNRYISLLRKKEQEDVEGMDYDSFCLALKHAVEDDLPSGYQLFVEQAKSTLEVVSECGDISLEYRFGDDYSQYIGGVPFKIIVQSIVDELLETLPFL